MKIVKPFPDAGHDRMFTLANMPPLPDDVWCVPYGLSALIDGDWQKLRAELREAGYLDSRGSMYWGDIEIWLSEHGFRLTEIAPKRKSVGAWLNTVPAGDQTVYLLSIPSHLIVVQGDVTVGIWRTIKRRPILKMYECTTESNEASRETAAA
jgi:hypothetical protein